MSIDILCPHGAIIQRGVEIGTGAVIGSSVIVTHSIDPFTIVTGIPARPIGKRFENTASFRT